MDYEAGKAIPNQQILAKMERALGKLYYYLEETFSMPVCWERHNSSILEEIINAWLGLGLGHCELEYMDHY